LLAAQRDISDNIAHETRTPLMMLENRLQAAMELAEKPELLIPLQAARAQVRSMLTLLDALLDIASAEAQRGDIKGLEYISLSEVARSISELYAASAEEAGVRLICEIDDEVRLQADAMQMSRLLVNLLDNAFKYGASGAFIRLSVAHGPIIIVEDDGPGIPESNRTHIFERYRRSGDGSRKGHGLGLALVKAIAERHGLVTHVETGENGGARFVVVPGREA
jgi:signal transduction histidine kinase